MSCPSRLSALGAPKPQRVCDQIDRIFKNFDDLNQLIQRVGSQIRQLETRESDLQTRISKLRVGTDPDCGLVEQARDRMKQMQQELDATRAQLEQLRSRQDGYATLEKVLGTIDANLSSLTGQAPNDKPHQNETFESTTNNKSLVPLKSKAGPASTSLAPGKSQMYASNFPAVLPPERSSLRASGPDDQMDLKAADPSPMDSGWKGPERKRFDGKFLPETKYPTGRKPHGLSSREDKLVSQQIEKAKREYLRKVKEAQKLEEQRNKWREWQRTHSPNREQKAIIAQADKQYQNKLYEVEKADARIKQMESWQAAGSIPPNLKTDIARKTARVPKRITKTAPGKKRVRFLDTLGSLPAPPGPNFGQ